METLNKSKQEIIKFKNERGEVETNRQELLLIIEEFYIELYQEIGKS